MSTPYPPYNPNQNEGQYSQQQDYSNGQQPPQQYAQQQQYAMPPSNPYAQQQVQPSSKPEGQYYGDKVQKLDEIKPRFVLSLVSTQQVPDPGLTEVYSRWNDLIFAILFLAQLFGFIALSVIALRNLSASNSSGGLGDSGGTAITLNSNYFLTIEAGIFGTVYFSGYGTKAVAFGAFKRASTYSMGSIAFGSLIVALLDLLRAGLQVLQQYESGQGDMIGAGIACCAQCCVGCVASLAQYFNRYAMIEIALYGKPYIKAAKDTWHLFRDRGIDALVNDLLINNIWTFGSYAVGALCSAFAFIYLKVVHPSYVENNGNIKSAVMGYAFMVGFTICHTAFGFYFLHERYSLLTSNVLGASTIFVGLAEDPQALAERDPELFECIRQTYPKVVMGV
ncbi:hypothetical protein P7C70_g3436, partial [Phenoliferia sp. Uapishka_3]